MKSEHGQFKKDVDQETQIDELISSLENIKRSEPNDLLYYKILNRLDQKEAYEPERGSYIGKIAAAFIVIAALNVFTILNYVSSDKTVITDQQQQKKETTNVTGTPGTIKDFAKEYFNNSDEYYYNQR